MSVAIIKYCLLLRNGGLINSSRIFITNLKLMVDRAKKFTSGVHAESISLQQDGATNGRENAINVHGNLFSESSLS